MNFHAWTRRQWLAGTGCGFGSLALQGLLQKAVLAAESPLSTRTPHLLPRAKRVIFLFMAGGPSQPDLFDPKPYIASKHGETISPPIDGHEVTVGIDKYLALAPDVPIRPRGQSGMLISDMLPGLAEVCDDICLLKAVHTDNEAHAPAVLQMHTGASIDVRPSLGSWLSYGLGTENENLPSFVTIHPTSDVRTYGAGFLPAAHQGTPVNVPGSPTDSAIKYLLDAECSPEMQRRRLDFVQQLNRQLLDRVESDQQMEGMIDSFELAFRMQSEAPALIDLASEPKSVQDLYGIGENDTDRNGKACLLARRMSEAGVRFVQVTMGGWDHHGNIRAELQKSCKATDMPVAGLIKDLKARGLLDETLVVWSGEFGRTPWSQDLSGTAPIEKHGREHQPESFCTWMAGGGVKAGFTYGETDDFGFRPIAGKVHLHDLHATMLHLLGLDHERLTHRHAGRDFRLTDVYGSVVKEILA
ncbi:DUF1501 domain-containing protein [Planctomicrobium piriforme]|uniref:Tat (Twin-arginine translocation) pathway signal sequence n=1 Tax=Planctomicrobium piriforme TaxID=1576369 RepID=A0A1I3CFD4_9PLAN|nr:DUF1501 domain-containing protein [Planctomicrobium piriforme]SFH73274.1 Protein of unknown function [Planctomicrobium piriforme]